MTDEQEILKLASELAAMQARAEAAEARLADIAKYGEIVEGAAKALGPRMIEFEEARARIVAEEKRAEAAEKERDMLKAALERRGEILFGREGD